MMPNEGGYYVTEVMGCESVSCRQCPSAMNVRPVTRGQSVYVCTCLCMHLLHKLLVSIKIRLYSNMGFSSTFDFFRDIFPIY